MNRNRTQHGVPVYSSQAQSVPAHSFRQTEWIFSFPDGSPGRYLSSTYGPKDSCSAYVQLIEGTWRFVCLSTANNTTRAKQGGLTEVRAMVAPDEPNEDF